MAEENYWFSVAVVGAMNPSIHHPAWYRLTEILTPEETQSAETSGTTLVTPQISQFSTQSITIVCEAARWQVHTTERSKMERVREIASKTFTVLDHTPVSAYGFNFNCHQATDLKDVKAVLARFIESLPLGLEAEPADRRSGKINYQVARSGRVLTTNVEPSIKGDNMVYVAVNADHRIPTPPPSDFKQFDLAALLNENFPIDHKDAEHQLASILAALNSSKEI
jgi:hypothetical protein